jgi:hypothetical protein
MLSAVIASFYQADNTRDGCGRGASRWVHVKVAVDIHHLLRTEFAAQQRCRRR